LGFIVFPAALTQFSRNILRFIFANDVRLIHRTRFIIALLDKTGRKEGTPKSDFKGHGYCLGISIQRKSLPDKRLLTVNGAKKDEIREFPFDFCEICINRS
jgi:hypothetical protein